jgi:uncharacterized membrane protein
MLNITLQQGSSLITMLLVTAAILALVAAGYRRVYRGLRPRQWWRLFGLRSTAIVVVLLLWFRPVFSLHRQVTERPALVFLVDSSASMDIADDAAGRSRLDQARQQLLEWAPRLAADYDLHWWSFAEGPRRLASAADLTSLRAEGQATSLSRALDVVATAAPGHSLEAVMLLSDGVHNAAQDPLKTARRLGAKVYTIGTGNTLRESQSYHDVSVTGLECPDRLTISNRARLTAYVEAVGFQGRVVQAVLEQDGQQVAQCEVVLDAAEGGQEVPFEFVPDRKGLHTYTARVSVSGDEKIGQNNHRSVSTLVVDSRIRVLYLEGTLRAEYGALVGRFLAKDPNVEFCALVQTRPNVFTQRTNIEGLQLAGLPEDPEELARFDVFLVGDLDSSYLKPPLMQQLRQRVSEGAGLMMIGGYHSLGPGGYAGTALEEALPVFMGPREVGQVTQPFLPVLTTAGRQHPIFANITSFLPGQSGPAQVEGLPPLEGCVRVQGPKPGATVLATCPVEAGGTGSETIVLAVQPFGKGLSAVFTADTTRNWQQSMRALDQESPFLRFWGQTVRWLAGRTEALESAASVVATTDKSYYDPEAPVRISAVVQNREGEGSSAAQVTARIAGPKQVGQPMHLAAVAGPAGHYEAVFEPPLPGRYEIEVAAELNDQKLAAEKLIVEVGRPNLEFDRLDLDERLLTAIATETGGRYAHISTADRVINSLEHQLRRRRVEMEWPLYWPPLCWGLFVIVLSGEWLLRREYQLR